MNYLNKIEDILNSKDIYPDEDTFKSISAVINSEFDEIVSKLDTLARAYSGVASGIIISNEATQYVSSKKVDYSIVVRDVE